MSNFNVVKLGATNSLLFLIFCQTKPGFNRRFKNQWYLNRVVGIYIVDRLGKIKATMNTPNMLFDLGFDLVCTGRHSIMP